MNIQELTKTYDGKTVVDSVSLEIPKGKVLSLIGPNGAGKSTVMGMISRLIARDEGLVDFHGKDISKWKSRELSKKLAILTQSNQIQMKLTVQELVAFGRQPYLDFGKRLAEADRQAIEEAIAEIGLEGLRHQRVDRLSGGERQKAFLAMVLAQRTRILALDEPTTYMDMAYQAEFFRLLAMLKQKRKVTVLLILHDLAQALQHADYIVLLDQKRVAFYGTAEECAASGLIPAVFGVQMHEFFENGKRFLAFS